MGLRLRKKSGKWYVFVSFHGQRKAKCIGTSRQAAEEVKRKLEARLALGDFGFLEERKEPTFAEYAERWLRQHAEIQCKPSTVGSYRYILRVHLLPHFGRLKLVQITREQIKEFVSDRVAEQKYSRNTLRLMLSTMRTIFSHAVEDKLVDRTPAAGLGRFAKIEKPARQATALTREESERLLEAAREFCADYYPLFLAALRAGLRRGELVALKWGDIQFGESEDDPTRYILVRRNYVRGQFTSPKSKRPRRVDLSRQLRRELLSRRDSRLLAAFQAGRTGVLDELVFPSKSGTVLDADNMVHRYFLPCVEKAGLRRIRFHDLRHTFGSLLIQDGAPLAYVKEQMGHSSIQVTVDIYSHLMPGANIDWMDRQDSETSLQLSATQAQPDTGGSEGGSPQPIGKNGTPGVIRTPDLLIRSQTLYPAELRAHFPSIISALGELAKRR